MGLKELFKRKNKQSVMEFVAPRSDLTPEQKAQLAKQMLKNPLYREVIDRITEELKELWANTSASDTETREQIWLMLQMLKKIDQKFNGYVNEAILIKEGITSQVESAKGGENGR